MSQTLEAPPTFCPEPLPFSNIWYLMHEGCRFPSDADNEAGNSEQCHPNPSKSSVKVKKSHTSKVKTSYGPLVQMYKCLQKKKRSKFWYSHEVNRHFLGVKFFPTPVLGSLFFPAPRDDIYDIYEISLMIRRNASHNSLILGFFNPQSLSKGARCAHSCVSSLEDEKKQFIRYDPPSFLASPCYRGSCL